MLAGVMGGCASQAPAPVAQLAPTMAADGGLPAPGLLMRVTPELRQKLLKEFFLA